MAAPAPAVGAAPFVELVRVIRSGTHESSHSGAVVVLDADGGVRRQAGDVHRPVFHRSCAKPFQAVAMLRAGFAPEPADLALAAASHTGETIHVDGVLAMLARAGRTEDELTCPPDVPSDRAALIAGGGVARRAAMNCSGKHAAMLHTCAVAGWDPTTVLDPGHPLQLRIRAVVEELTGERVAATGVDGCGAPVFATGLAGLARGFRALVTARTGSPERAVADAMRAHPLLVGGTTSPDTLLMAAYPGILAKHGADGVQVLALPDGRTAAFKIADGGDRARPALIAAVLHALDVDPGPAAALPPGTAVLGGGRPVGRVEVVPGLLDGITAPGPRGG